MADAHAPPEKVTIENVEALLDALANRASNDDPSVVFVFTIAAKRDPLWAARVIVALDRALFAEQEATRPNAGKTETDTVH